MFQARSQGFVGSGGRIPFELVDVNIGDAYDPSGLFTAPVAGIYQISYEFLAAASCAENHACASLFVNGTDFMESCSMYAASAGSSIMLDLSAGEQVWLVTTGVCFYFQDDSGPGAFNQFGGQLLHELP